MFVADWNVKSTLHGFVFKKKHICIFNRLDSCFKKNDHLSFAIAISLFVGKKMQRFAAIFLGSFVFLIAMFECTFSSSCANKTLTSTDIRCESQSNSEMIEFMEDVVRSISGMLNEWSVLQYHLCFNALNVCSFKSFHEQNKRGTEQTHGKQRKGCSTISILIIRCLFIKYNRWCANSTIRRQSLLFRRLDCESLYFVLGTICYWDLLLCVCVIFSGISTTVQWESYVSF